MTIIKLLAGLAAATATAAVVTAVKDSKANVEAPELPEPDSFEPEVPEPFEAFEPEAFESDHEDFMSSFFEDYEVPEAYSKWAKNGERLLRAKAERQALRFERKAERLERRNAKRNK